MLVASSAEPILDLSSNHYQKSITEASGLLRSIASDEFIASFHTNLYFSGYTKALSCLLQGSSQDVLTAYKEVEVVKDVLKKIRENVEKEFETVYKSISKTISLHDKNELSIPRCGRQTFRSNVEADTPQVYWRCTVFLPFLDHLLSELSSRFTEHNKRAIEGLQLLPITINSVNEERVKQLYEHFKQDLPAPESFNQEFKLWTQQWKSCSSILPQNISETLQQFCFEVC